MKIDVSSLLKKSGKRKRYSETWSADELSLDNELYSLADSLEVSLLLYNAEGILEVEGSYGGILEYYCNRCLREMSDPLNEDVKARFYPPERDLSEAIDETKQAELFIGNYSKDETVDIGRVIREDIVLNRPMQVLCEPECEGLCPECGADLNEEDCGHDTENIDPRLSKLQEIDLSDQG